jgi:hypothetical protein
VRGLWEQLLPGVAARDALRWLVSALGAAGVLVLAQLAAPHVPVSDLVAFLVAYGVVAASAVLSSLASPLFPRQSLVLVLIAIGALALVPALGLDHGTLTGAAIVTVALLLGATMIGSVVGGRIGDAGHLLVVGVVFTLVDTFSVLHAAGPTQAIVQSETLVSLVALPWPHLGAREPDIEPVLGMGDVIAAALFVAAARKHGLPLRRTALALFVGLGLACAVVAATLTPVPVLPFLSAAILVAHPEARRLKKEDRRPALVGLLCLIVLYFAIWRFSG